MSDTKEAGSEETGTWQPSGDRDHHRRSGELTAWELVRWAWRQLTSMRTALVLLLLLALGAIPGSVIPQSGVDALKTQNWQAAHPHLTPVYDQLGLFGVYHSPWFAAIYLLLMVSLVGCIVPRLFVYWRGYRADPPTAPRNLTRLPDHAAYTTDEEPDVVLLRAARSLTRRHRVSTGSTPDSTGSTPDSTGSTPDSTDGRGGWVAAERGQLREAGNLLFHLSVLLVLVGFGIGSLFGYKGGVILVVGNGFSNSLTQYDDFAPGWLFKASQMEPFCFTVNGFDVQWLESGPRQGMARGFQAPLTYRESCSGDPSTWSPQKSYDLRVNHPLTIGGTQIFLIGHGYAPVITVRDAQGRKVYDGPTIFLPESSNFESFGVVKATGPHARSRHRARGAVLPDLRARERQPGQRDGRRPQPHPVDAGLHRRPRPRHRRAAVGLRDGQGRHEAAEEARREDLPGRPAAGADGEACRTAPAPSPSTASSTGPACRSAAPPTCGSPCSASCWRWSGCWARCSSVRAGSGCGRVATAVRRSSRWQHWTGRGAVT